MTDVSLSYRFNTANVLELQGPDSLDLLHRLSTQDLLPLQQAPGVRQTILTTAQGKIVDWCWVVADGERVLLRTSAGRAARVAEWLERFIIMEDVQITDRSDAFMQLAVYGTGSWHGLQLETPSDTHHLQRTDDGYAWPTLTAFGEGCEVLLPRTSQDVWLQRLNDARIEERSSEEDTVLRLRAGVPSPTHEFKDEVNPLELRLKDHTISWNKGCYIGQEVISRMDSYDKVARLLIGFEGFGEIPSDIPQKDMRLFRDNRNIGKITSVAATPNGGIVGLAVVKQSDATPGEATLSTTDRTPLVSVSCVDRPFWHTPS